MHPFCEAHSQNNEAKRNYLLWSGSSGVVIRFQRSHLEVSATGLL